MDNDNNLINKTCVKCSKTLYFNFAVCPYCHYVYKLATATATTSDVRTYRGYPIYTFLRRNEGLPTITDEMMRDYSTYIIHADYVLLTQESDRGGEIIAAMPRGEFNLMREHQGRSTI